MERTRQPIPEGLADMPPGPELAAALAAIDLHRLGGLDCVEVLRARHRQVSHEQARFMAAMVEVGLCGIGPDDQLPRMDSPDEFSADEVRGALSWTRSAANTQLMLAWDLHTRLSCVFDALDSGLIDVPKAKVFSEWTSGLTDEQARQICDRLLPEAPRLTTGQLAERIKKMAIAIDPDWARRKYEEAVCDRKVIGYRNEDGTANVCGYNLPADRAAAACAHIDALARKIKSAGDDRPIAHIRADLYLGMLDGSYTRLSEADIITLVLTTNTEPTDANRSSGPGDHDGGHTDAVRRDDHALGEASASEGEAIGGPLRPTPSPRTPSPGRRTGVEVRAEITTLLGLDDRPAEIAGWGFVDAETARRLVFDQTAAEWRYALTDDDGRLLYEGITRHRPAGYPSRAESPCRGGIVELQIALPTLHSLAARPTRLGGWAKVIADLARKADQHATQVAAPRESEPHTSEPDIARSLENGPRHSADPADRRDGKPSRHDPDQLEAESSELGPCEAEPGKGADKDGEPSGYRPGIRLRRRTQIRDRTCVYPGCRAPAAGTDGDHTQDWAHAGATSDGNIGSLCRHDHRLKHDGRWTVYQPAPGHFTWTSRLGMHYHVRPPLIIEPLPSPTPRDLPPQHEPQPDGADAPIWWPPIDEQSATERPPRSPPQPPESPPF